MPRSLVHKIQPTPKSCGQTVLAMLLGVPVGDVFVKLKRTRGTTGAQLRRFLESRGRRVARETLYFGTLPDVAIVRIAWPGRRMGHWILWADRRFYDPGTRDPLFAVRAGRIVSFMEVT